MASITTVQLVDDLDGGEAAESIGFELDGKAYDIDLSEMHAAHLRDILAPYVAAARGSGTRAAAGRPRARATSSPTSRESGSAIREWAAQNGYSVSNRGRIRREVREAYERRQSAPPAVPALAMASPVIDAAVAPAQISARMQVADPFKLQDNV